MLLNQAASHVPLLLFLSIHSLLFLWHASERRSRRTKADRPIRTTYCYIGSICHKPHVLFVCLHSFLLCLQECLLFLCCLFSHLPTVTHLSMSLHVVGYSMLYSNTRKCVSSVSAILISTYFCPSTGSSNLIGSHTCFLCSSLLCTSQNVLICLLAFHKLSISVAVALPIFAGCLEHLCLVIHLITLVIISHTVKLYVDRFTMFWYDICVIYHLSVYLQYKTRHPVFAFQP